VNTQKTARYFEAECKTIKTLMEEYGHKRLDLLKIDVEGAEHEIIKSVIEDDIPMRIFCIEFDEIYFDDFKSFLDIRKSIKKLLKNGFSLINVDGPNYTFLKND
jgi:hypothetical protein